MICIHCGDPVHWYDDLMEYPKHERVRHDYGYSCWNGTGDYAEVWPEPATPAVVPTLPYAGPGWAIVGRIPCAALDDMGESVGIVTAVGRMPGAHLRSLGWEQRDAGLWYVPMDDPIWAIPLT